MASDLPTYVLEREFAAPRELVWRTLTEAELFCRWYGPNVETVAHRFDVKEGGLGLVEMRMKTGSGYQRMEFVEVDPPARLVWLNSNTDADWNIASNAGMPDWPRTLLTSVTLTEAGGTTRFRLEWSPHDASEAEHACFAAALDGLGHGWAAGMAILDELLLSMQGT